MDMRGRPAPSHHRGVLTEEPLAGGVEGVVRVGDTVRRPVTATSASVRALLLHLEDVGFDGAPRYLGQDQQGREVLTFIQGDVPLPPYPQWSMTDEALADLGRLLRRLHEATASFDLAAVSGWADWWSDPLGGPVVCHNDVFPENAVFRGGRVVGLIDFAMAAPGRPLWDLAIAAQEWGPLNDPAIRREHPRHLDGVARLRILARSYGIEPDQATELVDLVYVERRHAIAHIRSEIAAGNTDWIANWSGSGGDECAAADDAWLQRQRAALLDAVAG
jgi:Ser/Thr protein kinase RdoA (MazF antagonist)